MTYQFKAVTLNYKCAPVAVREQVALSQAEAAHVLAQIKDTFSLQDALVLSTCNRTEIYYTGEASLARELISIIAFHKGLVADAIAPFFSVIDEHDAAVRHLFEVSLGLQSQVVGDMQIINQVKQGYQLSADAAMAGPFMHRLLHTIFFANKRVVQETSFRDGAASVSYAAAELAEELCAQFAEPRVLVLGLGEMGRDVALNLKNGRLNQVAIANRTFEKAQSLALQTGFKALSLEQALDSLQDYDLVISSVAAPQPLITGEMLRALNILSFKFFIDLSVPRSIDPAIEEVHGALLYNIDKIQARANAALEARIASIPHVTSIMEEALVEFNDWSREMLVNPTINKLKTALEQIRLEELQRFSRQLNDEERKLVDRVTTSMMQKIIKLPVLQLKAACKRGEADTLIDVLNDLFNLESQPAGSHSHH